MTSARTIGFVAVGYALPALISGVALAATPRAGDVVSVVAFAAGQGFAYASLRWTIVATLGFLVGWSFGIGVAALAGLGVAIVASAVAHRPLAEAELHALVFPLAGAVGGAATGTLAGGIELLGGLHLPVWRWLGANAAGGALTGVCLLLAFTTHAAPGSALAALAAAIAGAAWGGLVVYIRTPVPA